MAQISYEEAKQKNLLTEASGYFVLQDDGDRAQVRFLYESAKDIQCETVHEVKYEGRTRKVRCLKKDIDDPDSTCPFCQLPHPNSRRSYMIRVYIPLLNIDKQEVELWERSEVFATRIARMCEEFYPLYDRVIEIERQGAKGDPKTKYVMEDVTDMFDPESDEDVLQFDFKDYLIPSPVTPRSDGSAMLLERTLEEAQYYLDNGKFEDDTTTEYNANNNQRNYRNNVNNDDNASRRRYSSRTNEGEADNNGRRRSRREF